MATLTLQALDACSANLIVKLKTRYEFHCYSQDITLHSNEIKGEYLIGSLLKNELLYHRHVLYMID